MMHLSRITLFNINRPRMILKENSAVAVVTELSCTFDGQINHTLLVQCCFLLCGYFSYQFDLYIQLNNINLKLKMSAAIQDACYACATYIVYHKIHIIFVPNYY